MNTETNSVISGSLVDYKKMYLEIPDIDRSELKRFKGADQKLLGKLLWTIHQLYSLTPPELIPSLEIMGIMGRPYRREFVKLELRGAYRRMYDKLRENEKKLIRELGSQQAEDWVEQLKAIDFGGNENDDHER
ncbi:MAG: hypothetical protein EXS37_08040 [Opitutus sp.]|nr:hypothetical protein [Opitutus sp.]